MAEPLTVHDIVVDYLREHGYAGLCSDDCGCGVDDLVLCGSYSNECSPAYRNDCDTCAHQNSDASSCICDDGPTGDGCYSLVSAPKKAVDGH